MKGTAYDRDDADAGYVRGHARRHPLPRPEHTQQFFLCIAGEPVPTARPRVVHGHAFTPARSHTAQQQIRSKARGLPAVKPGAKVALHAAFYYRHNRARDLDNLLKTILDGLQPHPLVNDSMQLVNAVSLVACRVAADPRTEIWLTYEPAQ